MPRIRWATLGILLAAGCGARYPVETPVALETAFSLTEDPTSPTAAPDGGTVNHPLGAQVTLIAGGPDYVVAATGAGPFRLVSTLAPRQMPLVTATATQPVGAITAFATRQVAGTSPDGTSPPVTGLLAASSDGLLQDFTDFFERSPLSDQLPSLPGALDDTGTGETEVVWAGVPGGVTRISASASRTFKLAGVEARPDAVLEVDASVALLAFGGKVYALRYTDGQAAELPHDFGQVIAMARGGSGSALLATRQGLYVREASGAFTHLALGALSGVAYDPLGGAYVTSSNALLVRRDNGSMEALGVLGSGGPHPLAVDGFGDVWVGEGANVIQFHAGSPVTYVNQVKPFFAAHCYACHVTGSVNGSPRLALDDYDGTRGLVGALIRRVSGEGGSPMPPAPPLGEGQLSPSEYGVLIRWARSGEQP